MTRIEFAALPLNTQWALVETLAFGGNFEWDFNEAGQCKWVDCEAEIFPDMQPNIQKVAKWLEESTTHFEVSIPCDGAWLVYCRRAGLCCRDTNLPWAILMAAGISEDRIVEPNMIKEAQGE